MSGIEKRKKKNKYVRLFTVAFHAIQVFFMTFFFYFSWYDRFNSLKVQQFQGKGNLLMITVFFLLIVVSFRIWGGFKLGYSKLIKLIFSQFLAILTAGVGIYAVLVLVIGSYYQLGTIAVNVLGMMLLDFILCVSTDILGIQLYIAIFPPLKLLQINGDYTNHLKKKISNRSDKYIVQEEISIHADEKEIFAKMGQYDAVLLNDIPNESRKKLLKYCFEKDIPVYYTPKIQDILVKSSDEITLFDSPLFLSKNIGLNFEQAFVKRAMDIVVSLLALVLLSPLLLIVAVSIKLEDGGAVFYKQKRCTCGGKEFWIYKFRSMKEDAEKDGKPRPATENDDRITRVGNIIRRVRIDELPQLINILKGEMALVGPRPERVEHVKSYTEDVPEFAYRLKVKGGLTGYAQVYGRYNTTAYDKLKMDLLYVANYSLFLDFQILLETVKILFSKESTEGFEEECEEKIGERVW